MRDREKFKYNGSKRLSYEKWEVVDICENIETEERMLMLAPFVGDKENEMFIYPFGHLVVLEKTFYNDFLVINKDGTLESQVGEYEELQEKVKEMKLTITDEVIDKFIGELEKKSIIKKERE